MLVGRQEPRLLSQPGTAVSSAGPEVVALGATAGLVADPWQAIALDATFGELPTGSWAAREVAYLTARQNGKGGILHLIDLAALFLFDDVKEILHSAHEFKTAKKAYRELREIIKATPHLFAQVERRGTRVVGFRNSNEDTSITLQDGTVLRFMARSHNTGRGFSPQMVIVDEAQECTEDTRQALLYTVRAQANPLVVWCGTVPTPRNNGEVFKGLRDRGRAGGDPHLVWMEWSPEPDVDLHSDEAIVQSNPGIPYRITMDTVRAERDGAVSEEAWAGYCREALSWWPDDDPDGESAWEIWSKETWWACGEEPTDGPWLTGTVELAVEMPQDRASASIVVAGERIAGGWGIDVVAHAPGTGWVAPIILERWADKEHPVSAVTIDPGGPAASLIDELEAEGVTVRRCKYADIKVATATAWDAVDSGRLHHRQRPELDQAAARATWRPAGDTRIIDRRAGVDVSPLTGGILALWGHQQAPVAAAPEPDFIVI